MSLIVTTDWMIEKFRGSTNYESVELTESARDSSSEWTPERLRAESVAVLSWRLVCSCMILTRLLDWRRGSEMQSGAYLW
jgi:hypothetical protein